MKIKTVDDKPMVIHTKKRAKIHTREPKTAGCTNHNRQNAVPNNTKETAVGGHPAKRKHASMPRRKTHDPNKSIKIKETSLHVAGAAGAAAAAAATEQMEGGKEVQQAAVYAYTAAGPVIGAASRGASRFKEKTLENRKRRIKKVDSRSSRQKTAAKEKVDAKSSGKEHTKETTAKNGRDRKGKTAGNATKSGSLNRQLKFFLDKMKSEENQQDSVLALAKDLVTKYLKQWVQAVLPAVGTALLGALLIVLLVALPVVVVIGVVYNSPFALFLPALGDGDTVQSVASAYVAEFNREVSTAANDHTGCDAGETVYINYEGTDATPSNYYDIMAVYMVKYGVGDTATVMNDKTKGWLKTVVDDMCTYSTTTKTVTTVTVNENGRKTKVKTKYLYVNVTLKTYEDMISEYSFTDKQAQLLEQLMNSDYMGQTGGAGDGTAVCTLTESEIQTIVSGITDSTQKSVCDFALHRVGYPYSQDYRDSGNYYDCSSLAYYSWKSAGKDIAYDGANTAAAEAEGLESAGCTVSYDELQPGDLIFYSYTQNGRYKNISHVAVYVGNGKVVEALNRKSGVIYRDVANVGSIVLIERP